MAKNFYDVLNVQKNASADEIKKAYRKLAHQYHPDKKGGDAEKFKGINEAYQVLSDTQKRQQYDQFGSSGFGTGQSGAGGFDFSQGFQGFRSDINMEDIFDIFGNVFSGGATRGRRSSPEEDIYIEISVSFFESARGVKKTLNLDRYVGCEKCGITGARGGDLATCTECGGTGHTRKSTRSIFGAFSQVHICQKCNGIGKIPKHKCEECNGTGRKKLKKEIEVTIPAGVEDGQTLFVDGFGNAGLAGSEAGNLYIRMRVLPDAHFKRRDRDVISEVLITLTQAVLGAEISVPTLDGIKTLKIKAGTRDGDTYRISGAGIGGSWSDKGDQVIIIKIDIPQKISKKARKLLEELETEL